MGALPVPERYATLVTAAGHPSTGLRRRVKSWGVGARGENGLSRTWGVPGRPRDDFGWR